MIVYSSYAIHYIPVTYVFYNWSLYRLIHFTYFCQSPTSLAPENHHFAFCKSVIVLFCLLCFLDSTYKWDHAVFTLLWFISLNKPPSESIHVVADCKISFSFMFEWFHCLYIAHLFYIHLLMDIKVASISWLLQIIATKNIGVHTSL